MEYNILSEQFLEKLCHDIYGDNFIHYEKIEKELGKLKFGGALKYENLDFIQEEWPLFSEWYQWPSEDQFNNKIRQLKIDFSVLGEHQLKDSYGDDERNLFDKLYFVFNHIELVSIFLRFVDSKRFGIYSPPVAYYLNSPRGINYQDEYFNYLIELNKYKILFELDKVAYVDMFFWVLAKTNQYPDVYREEYIEVKSYQYKVKMIQNSERISQVLPSVFKNKSLLGVAETLYKVALYDNAAMFAGLAFEKAVKELCDQMGLYTKYFKKRNKMNIPHQMK